MTCISAYFLVIFKGFLFISAILYTQKEGASIIGPDDIKKIRGLLLLEVCFYWRI